MDPALLACDGLGLTGEAGEVAELLKKHVGHGHALDRDKLAKELGDVFSSATVDRSSPMSCASAATYHSTNREAAE